MLSIKDLKVIIHHFDNYPLKTKKQIDYLLFKETLELIEKKEHLTIGGLKKIVNLRASMNKGLPEVLKETFPGAIPSIKPLTITPKEMDPN